MEKVDILIIGGGIIGLAVARTLSEDYEDVVLVEKEESFGRHSSSRNSEVLHSGIYYPPTSLKAKLCVRGLEMIYDYAQIKNVPHSRCGKMVVATTEDEIPELLKLKENGVRNGVQNLEILSAERCRELEPQIKAIQALYVPSTGIIDTHSLMEKLEDDAEKNGAFIVYDMKVISIDTLDDGYMINFANGEVFAANRIINCAGLHSDEIAKMVGIKVKREKLELYWCKGEYYKSNKIKNIDHLIYPLPDPLGIHLGIHLTINLRGDVRFGPNAYYVNELNYNMDETYKQDFLAAINRYIDVNEDELQLDDCGIRAKLQPEGGAFRDFYVEEESLKGYPNFINCIGIESPGITASLALAEEVKNLL